MPAARHESRLYETKWEEIKSSTNQSTRFKYNILSSSHSERERYKYKIVIYGHLAVGTHAHRTSAALHSHDAIAYRASHCDVQMIFLVSRRVSRTSVVRLIPSRGHCWIGILHIHDSLIRSRSCEIEIGTNDDDVDDDREYN